MPKLEIKIDEQDMLEIHNGLTLLLSTISEKSRKDHIGDLATKIYGALQDYRHMEKESHGEESKDHKSCPNCGSLTGDRDYCGPSGCLNSPG